MENPPAVYVQRVMKQRKQQHLDLADLAHTPEGWRNPFFNYEPLLGTHPQRRDILGHVPFLGKTMGAPLWISSMTGGVESSKIINRNLAQVCAEFSLGMGLGSCRTLLENDSHIEDFDLRPILGNGVPFYANLGVAQLEQAIQRGRLQRICDLVGRLRACGLIIHVNPLQEWFQPEGDRFTRPPIESIRELVEKTHLKIIVKEVGQGMGPKSLEALMDLPLAAIEFGAFGGTNFSKIEQLRRGESSRKSHALTLVGHPARNMIMHINTVLDRRKVVRCKNFIISGGINSSLTGLELIKSCQGNCVFAMARAFLNAAKKDYNTLRCFVREQLEELAMAHAFLDIPNPAEQK